MAGSAGTTELGAPAEGTGAAVDVPDLCVTARGAGALVRAEDGADVPVSCMEVGAGGGSDTDGGPSALEGSGLPNAAVVLMLRALIEPSVCNVVAESSYVKKSLKSAVSCRRVSLCVILPPHQKKAQRHLPMEIPAGGFAMTSGLGGERGVTPQFERDVAVSLRVFLECAAEDAALYADAAGRSAVLPRDMALALTANAVGDFWRHDGLPERLAQAAVEFDQETDEEDGTTETEETDTEEAGRGGGRTDETGGERQATATTLGMVSPTPSSPPNPDTGLGGLVHGDELRGGGRGVEDVGTECLSDECDRDPEGDDVEDEHGGALPQWTRAEGGDDDEGTVVGRLNSAERRWEEWTPSTPLERAVARAVERAWELV